MESLLGDLPKTVLMFNNNNNNNNNNDERRLDDWCSTNVAICQ
jgi:hypothetical protein